MYQISIMEDKIMSEEKKVETQSTSLTASSGFALIDNLATIQEALSGECAGLDFTFDRIRIPSGGGLAFEVPGEEDDPDLVTKITAVIAYQHPAYAYYASAFHGGNNPPDCGSFDGEHGVGNPGGDCHTCPFNKFGSGEGKGKACKNRQMLYLLREGEIFPVMMSIPTGSLKSYTDYVKKQITRGRRLNSIVTEISLKKAESKQDNGSITFSRVTFRFVRMLNADEKEYVAKMVDLIKGYADNLTSNALIEDEDSGDGSFVDAETGEVIEPLK
jgi:hypothetical protein